MKMIKPPQVRTLPDVLSVPEFEVNFPQSLLPGLDVLWTLLSAAARQVLEKYWYVVPIVGRLNGIPAPVVTAAVPGARIMRRPSGWNANVTSCCLWTTFSSPLPYRRSCAPWPGNISAKSMPPCFGPPARPSNSLAAIPSIWGRETA